MNSEVELQSQKQLKINSLYAALNIQNSKYARLYSSLWKQQSSSNKFHDQPCLTGYINSSSNSNNSNNIVSSNSNNLSAQYHSRKQQQSLQYNVNLLQKFQYKSKKTQQKLVRMQFLKDSNYVILGYDKQTDRGDINFIAVNQLKNKDFYYNKLSTGVGGIQCFQDGRNILIADKKGVFSFIDMFKQLNYADIDQKKIQTGIDGVLDFSLSPAQNKIVCGLADKKCVVLDIQKQRKNRKFVQCKSFQRHIYSVNSLDWHPYKSLIVSSSVDLSDSVKLWDPHSQQLVHESNMHKCIVHKVLFHPEGNTYFSLRKDNIIVQNQLRKRGIVNTFSLDFQPTQMQVLNNNNIAVGDNGGYMNWFTSQGQIIGKFGGESGIALFAIDQSNSVLVIGREKQHKFQIYSKKNALRVKISQ